MSALTHAMLVRDFEPVGLAELASAAGLCTRKDRKYVVPRSAVAPLLAELRHSCRVLEIGGLRSFRYESTYFDTPGLDTYLAAARRRPRRFKVRTRAYLDSRECLLELKCRERHGLTVKHRMPYRIAERALLTAGALEFLASFEQVGAVKESLTRSLTTRYERTTLMEAGSASRVTIDTGLVCVTPAGAFVGVPGLVIVETKSVGPPTAADRLLWAAHIRPTRISKYCTGLAAIDPQLPCNRWHRVLSQHFRTGTDHPTSIETEGRDHEAHEDDRGPRRSGAAGLSACSV